MSTPPPIYDVCRRALETYGQDAQVNMAMEECAELIAALNHHRRTGRSGADVCGELADVYIMFSQLRLLFGEAAVDASIVWKADRLSQRLDDDQPRSDPR